MLSCSLTGCPLWIQWWMCLLGSRGEYNWLYFWSNPSITAQQGSQIHCAVLHQICLLQHTGFTSLHSCTVSYWWKPMKTAEEPANTSVRFWLSGYFSSIKGSHLLILHLSNIHPTWNIFYGKKVERRGWKRHFKKVIMSWRMRFRLILSSFSIKTESKYLPSASGWTAQ